MQSEEKCFIIRVVIYYMAGEGFILNYVDEKDYIMRMIKEMVQVLASVILGKKYVAVELEQENKFSVSGRALGNFREMIDRGEINEAENILLEEIHYENKEEVLAAALFYQYIGEKEEKFLLEHQYSKEEALSGMENLIEKSGYKELADYF